MSALDDDRTNDPVAAAASVRPGRRRPAGLRPAGGGWLYLLAGLMLAIIIFLAMARYAASLQAAAAAPAPAAAAVVAAPPPAPVIPTGAGITSETVDGKPVVKVYFDTGKSEIATGFAAAVAALRDYETAHGGAGLDVSGYTDKTGNAAANAVLAKQRAEAVKAALVAAGFDDKSIALVKPAETTDTADANTAARHVDIAVR